MSHTANTFGIRICARECGVWALEILEMSGTQSCRSGEHCRFVPGKLSCLLKDNAGHFTSSSFPRCWRWGWHKTFQGQSCPQPAPELAHTGGTHTSAPSCSSFCGSCCCQTASHGPQIPGFRTYSHSRSRRNSLQNVQHHQHSSHWDILSALWGTNWLRSLSQSWVGTKCIRILSQTVVSMATCVTEEG